ncbi:MAG TPA: S1C family serine protease [Acetobacteraceae bacterium]|jgi:S1-C subfamily serine protease|nr:S1C family serine protease [Acetobacteraceae bacterium]
MSMPLSALSDDIAGLVTAAAPGLVAVRSHRLRSSGFLWRPDLVVTADEALAEGGEVTVVLPGGDALPAEVAGRDPGTDIALLRLPRAAGQAARLATPPLALGSLAIALGAEEGQPTAALGLVSRLDGPWRSLRGGEIAARIELDLAMRRSAEGGLALDARGGAIGMAVFGPRRRVLVIPSATIERVAPLLERHGRVARGYLGLGLQPVALQGGEGIALMAMSVDPKGPAAAAGLHQGDVIVTLDGAPVRELRGLLRALGPESVGRAVILGVRRGGQGMEIPVTVAERPAA